MRLQIRSIPPLSSDLCSLRLWLWSLLPVLRESFGWTPLADITEDEKEYLIKAELPEIKKEDVKVTVENGVLTISGERKFEKEEKNKKYHRVERGYGTFMRSFTLPDDADANKIKAEFKNGLLKVHLPKSEHAKPKQIEVNVA